MCTFFILTWLLIQNSKKVKQKEVKMKNNACDLQRN